MKRKKLNSKAKTIRRNIENCIDYRCTRAINSDDNEVRTIPVCLFIRSSVVVTFILINVAAKRWNGGKRVINS